MRRNSIAMLLVGMLLGSASTLSGDTGTYRITSYKVGLTPHSDGTVAIDYYQKWLVTGGHIPWITVGAPNSDFTISGRGGAVSVASDASESGWSGVRCDLDADYQSGQTFEASFSIVQRGLFYADSSSYHLDFTPGWYDRATTDTLRVSVAFFADIATVTADPKPSFSSGDEMVWYAYDLGRGERFRIHVSFPRKLFPAGIAETNLRGGGRTGSSAVPAVVVFVIFVLVMFIIIMSIASRYKRYSGGRTYYGGIFGGGHGGGIAGGGRSSGGGGGFGGASTSCACACVSCACACACAGGGGGGAGCGRKLEHTCPACEGKRGR